MKIVYTSDNEAPAFMELETLIANFNENDGWKYPAPASDIQRDHMRDMLEWRGWYDGVHDEGRYLVISCDKLKVEPSPELLEIGK